MNFPAGKPFTKVEAHHVRIGVTGDDAQALIAVYLCWR